MSYNKYSVICMERPVIDISDPDDNIWNADIKLRIYKLSRGWAVYQEEPSGYSSWTYDPDQTFRVIEGDWKEFWNKGLDDPMRERLRQEGLSLNKEPK